MEELHLLSRLEAAQQPDWGNANLLQEVRKQLRGKPALVRYDDVLLLKQNLKLVATGRALIVQAGDCAESILDQHAPSISRKVGLLDLLAGQLQLRVGLPVLKAGRIAGQFAKPRSAHVEYVDGRDIPSYRGDMVNGFEPTAANRTPDPRRLLEGYEAARSIIAHLEWGSARSRRRLQSRVWTSHEALLLDYELPFLRRERNGPLFLGSTHWPWIGDRTRQIRGAHVALLASLANPVACKVGRKTAVDDLIELCALLDPNREPGRLTLISRMGADHIRDHLGSLVERVREEGHCVIWLCDPMHGNTRTAPCGRKTRFLSTMMQEVVTFCDAVTSGGGVAGGLHLEATPEDVSECVFDEHEIDGVGHRYTSLCDPRLNPRQALALVASWPTPQSIKPSSFQSAGDYRHDLNSADRLVSPSSITDIAC